MKSKKHWRTLLKEGRWFVNRATQSFERPNGDWIDPSVPYGKSWILWQDFTGEMRHSIHKTLTAALIAAK